MLIQEKLRQAVGILNELSIDCWLTFVRESGISGEPTMPFLLSSDVTWHSAFIVTRCGRICAIVGELDRKAVEDLGVYQEVIGYVEAINPPLVRLLEEIAPKQIAINYSKSSEICDGLTHGMYLTLLDILKPIQYDRRLISSEPVISRLRARKTETELERVQAAIRQTQEIFDLAAGFIHPGLTEKEIARFMLDEVKRRGLETAWDRAHCPAVFTGPDTAGAHYRPTGRAVEPGHVLNMDFGVKVEDYCSDLQRTFYILEPGQDQARGGNWLPACRGEKWMPLPAAKWYQQDTRSSLMDSDIRSAVSRMMGRHCWVRHGKNMPVKPLSRWKGGWSSPWSPG